ncbi:unnamed protein product [Larinioides sclopetarius]|uniref:Uncharacterized protein n=1 Tax=Larinioides sclopetarius TaxID=280406 RepID=A0AAV2BNE5_9ARAC
MVLLNALSMRVYFNHYLHTSLNVRDYSKIISKNQTCFSSDLFFVLNGHQVNLATFRFCQDFKSMLPVQQYTLVANNFVLLTIIICKYRKFHW